MILEGVELRNVGPFIEATRLGPLDPGINVLAANNEFGKTTVIRALTRALFDRHTCKSEEIRSLQPVGTELAPRITVVFQCSGDRFRIEKTFLESPRAQLSRGEGSQWRLLAEGDAADQKVQELLQTGQPGRGASKPEHWGLFQYLWARQGESLSWPQWSGEAGRQVRSRLVQVELDPMIEKIKCALETEFLELFTEQGRLRAKGPLVENETRLQELQQELSDVQNQLNRTAEIERMCQELEVQIARLECEAKELQTRADQSRVAAQNAEKVLARKQAKQQELESAQKELSAIDQDLQKLTATCEAMSKMQKQKEDLEQQQKMARVQEAPLMEQIQELRSRIKSRQKERDQSQTKLDALRNGLKLRQWEKEIRQCRQQLTQAEKSKESISHLENQLALLPHITAQQLKQLEKLEKEIHELHAKLEVLGITVELDPENSSSIEIKDDETSRTLQVEPGQPERVTSGQSIELRLRGWGTLRVRSGADEVKSLQARHDELKRKIESELSELGTSTRAQAEDRLAKRKDLETKRNEVQKELRQALGTWESLEQLRQYIQSKNSQLDNLRSRSSIENSFENLDQEALETETELEEENLRRTAQDLEQLNDFLHQLLAQRERVRSDLHQTQHQLATVEERIRNHQSLAEEIKNRYADGIDAVRRRRQISFVEAEARLEAVKAELPPDAEKMPDRAQREAQATRQIQEELKNKQAEHTRLLGQLEALGAYGLYSRETALLEKRASLQEETAALRRRGWAARMLRDLLDRRKQAATRSVLAPLQQRLSNMFGELTGVRERQVFLDETLSIRGVGRNESEIHEFELLSQGAKEQLLLSLRLTVAASLSENTTQTVILDDVLVNTDETRQQRVLDLLQNNSPKLQILILTCHPDRYRGVGKKVDLQVCPHSNE